MSEPIPTPNAPQQRPSPQSTIFEENEEKHTTSNSNSNAIARDELSQGRTSFSRSSDKRLVSTDDAGKIEAAMSMGTKEKDSADIESDIILVDWDGPDDPEYPKKCVCILLL